MYGMNDIRQPFRSSHIFVTILWLCHVAKRASVLIADFSVQSILILLVADVNIYSQAIGFTAQIR